MNRFLTPLTNAILGRKGTILGYTIANDVSAWDIERANPLYLPQSKTYDACCALGPYIVTVDEIADPYTMDMTCKITRGATTRFEGATSTARLNRRFDQLVEYLLLANDVPSCSIVLTGTGIIVTEESALAEGDVVTIGVPQLGELRNPMRVV